ncbi:HAD-IA family hydrolase [Streptosporangium sp. NPDC020145]|uniref:HAD family hydrolase n=1 Tax=Streptosporangium sp. NPDC020145 TaxID=3154694 RepID=UPI00342C73C3
MNADLAEVLRPVKHVLIDFDGPICSVFAGLPAPEVAQRLRAALLSYRERPSTSWESETDPLALLRRISTERPDLVGIADAALTRLEEEAIQLACPTLGGEAVLRACGDSGRTAWMVSNNASSAIRAYLNAHGLSSQVAGVFGRVPGDPASMKPSPRLLLDAMNAAGSAPAECVFIGDAVRDVEAGNAAGVPTIGYANKPGKGSSLAAAGAVAVVGSMKVIADALL